MASMSKVAQPVIATEITKHTNIANPFILSMTLPPFL